MDVTARDYPDPPGRQNELAISWVVEPGVDPGTFRFSGACG
jgi:hypothetical protein